MTEVLIKRGVSGLPSVPRSGTPGTYPYEAIKVAKLLRAAGLTVSFEDEKADREYVTHDAGEFWLPVLQFGASVGSGVLGGVLVELIKGYLPSRSTCDQRPGSEQRLLHLEIFQGDERIVLDGSV